MCLGITPGQSNAGDIVSMFTEIGVGYGHHQEGVEFHVRSANLPTELSGDHHVVNFILKDDVVISVFSTNNFSEPLDINVILHKYYFPSEIYFQTFSKYPAIWPPKAA